MQDFLAYNVNRIVRGVADPSCIVQLLCKLYETLQFHLFNSKIWFNSYHKKINEESLIFLNMDELSQDFIFNSKLDYFCLFYSPKLSSLFTARSPLQDIKIKLVCKDIIRWLLEQDSHFFNDRTFNDRI